MPPASTPSSTKPAPRRRRSTNCSDRRTTSCVHEVVLRSEQFVERRLRGAGFVDDGVDAGGIDAVFAEEAGCGVQQASARRFVITAITMSRGGTPLRR